MSWSFVLPFARIPDGLSLNSRAHWAVKNRSTQQVRQLVVAACRREGIEPMQRVQVELIWCAKDRRTRDVDNLIGLYKAVTDGLASDRGVSARLVPDDSPEYVTKLMPRIEYRPDDDPHFMVVVTNISYRSADVDRIVKERNL